MESLHGQVPDVPSTVGSASASAFLISSSPPDRPAVKFLPEPKVAFIESSRRTRVNMAKQVFETFTGGDVTNAMLVEAAELFGANYGIWGELSGRAGKPVELSARRLREQYLPEGAISFYTKVTVDGILAGNAFACRWQYGDKTVCWVTQLVVDKNYRERGLAGGLLRSLRLDTDSYYGIMSSHPAACLAAATSFGTTIEKISLDFIRVNADAIMRASPVPYVRDARLCGTLFDPKDPSGLVSGVDTGFFVDHREPLEALDEVRETWQWPLGSLPDGHEFLLIIPSRHRRSSAKSAHSIDIHR